MWAAATVEALQVVFRGGNNSYKAVKLTVMDEESNKFVENCNFASKAKAAALKVAAADICDI